MSETLFTNEELSNLLALVEAGARAIASQNPLSKAGEILIVANALAEKVKQLSNTNVN